jgi:hypothetical protein
LKELKSVYSLEDVYWLIEVDYIPEYNQRRLAERQQRLSEMKRLIK